MLLVQFSVSFSPQGFSALDRLFTCKIYIVYGLGRTYPLLDTLYPSAVQCLKPSIQFGVYGTPEKGLGYKRLGTVFWKGSRHGKRGTAYWSLDRIACT